MLRVRTEPVAVAFEMVIETPGIVPDPPPSSEQVPANVCDPFENSVELNVVLQGEEVQAEGIFEVEPSKV